MGGSAFASGDDPLHTPRMPPDVYEAVRDRCHTALLSLYSCVASPIDGPAKKDYGDIDILMALPKHPSPCDALALDAIAKALHAERVIVGVGNGCAANLAIPWPRELLVAQELNDLSESSKPRHIQVDVRVSPSLESFHWTLFAQSHGDLSNILGTMLRPHGLTISESALWLRVPEIEEIDKKRARVLLSRDPEEVLSFVGLPVDTYWDRPFASLRDMYEYAARCRFMHISPLANPAEGQKTQLQKLKANDRRRMTYRAAFRKWIEEFIPECREQGRFAEQTMTRDDVRELAFARFHVEREYNARLEAFLAESERNYIRNHTIKDHVPIKENPSEGEILYRSCLVGALKRIVLEDDASYGVVPAKSLKDSRGRFIMERVVEFILDRQEEVGIAAMERHHVRVNERQREKRNKSLAVG